MRPRDRLGAVAWAVTMAVAALLVLAGCLSGPATVERPPGGGTSTSNRVDSSRLEALRTTLGFYLQDRCASGDPAEVYPRCARFTAEIRNVLRQIPPGPTGRG